MMVAGEKESVIMNKQPRPEDGFFQDEINDINDKKNELMRIAALATICINKYIKRF